MSLSPYALAADRLDPPAPLTQAEIFSRLDYTPTPKQWEFHTAAEDDVLYGGAAGGGKTRALVMDAFYACSVHPGLRAGLYRRTYDELAESVIPELARIGFGEGFSCRWDAAKRDLHFRNGSEMRLRYLESVLDASRRQGGEYQWLGFEERTLLPPGVAPLVMERLRTRAASAVPVLGVRSTSNPGGPSHSEVKARYVTSTDKGGHVAVFCALCQEFVVDGHCKCPQADAFQQQSIRFIPAKVSDNPHVDRGYVARLMAIPDPARRAAMLDGSWDSFGGQVFTEWRFERHVVQPFGLPESWSRWAGIDWGFTAPWVVLWGALDEDGRVWIYRELIDREVHEKDQARRILEAEEGGTALGNPDDSGRMTVVPEPAAYRCIDPSTAARRGDAQSTMAAYQEAGCAVVSANNDRISGIQRVHSFLADGPACPHHRALGWETCPKVHVFPACRSLIETLPALPRDPARQEDVDTRADDHAYDAFRYLLMGLGGRPQVVSISDEAYDEINPIEGVRRPFAGYALPRDHESPWGDGV